MYTTRGSRYVFLTICVIILCVIGIITIENSKQGTLNFESGDGALTNIADLFVQPGKVYREKDGIIYHCLSGQAWNATSFPKSVRRFSSHLDSSAGAAERSKAFQDIFDKRKWKYNDPKDMTVADKMSPEHQVSGHGSTLKATQAPLALLNSIIERLKAHLKKPVIKMIDIPCGDFFWMRELVGQRPDIEYTGVDIVPTLIERHKINFKHMKNARFMNMDVVSSGLNESYDFIFSRDMLQHLPTAALMQALEHFSNSGSKLLVATNLKTDGKYREIAPGGYRHLDITLPPVNIVPPVCQMWDDAYGFTKFVGVWTLPLKQKID